MRSMHIAALAAVALAVSAEAFEAVQTFRDERVTRGNVNLRVLQPADEADWCPRTRSSCR